MSFTPWVQKGILAFRRINHYDKNAISIIKIVCFVLSYILLTLRPYSNVCSHSQSLIINNNIL